MSVYPTFLEQQASSQKLTYGTLTKTKCIRYKEFELSDSYDKRYIKMKPYIYLLFLQNENITVSLVKQIKTSNQGGKERMK